MGNDDPFEYDENTFFLNSLEIIEIHVDNIKVVAVLLVVIDITDNFLKL
jgi:hypothetical protein